MNKAIVDQEIPAAYDALRDAGIVKNGNEIQKTFRGQIETFGAAITMGSLRAAIAFFGSQGRSDVSRPALLDAIRRVLDSREESQFHSELLGKQDDFKDLLDYTIENEDRAKNEIINAAIALKLAMNLYKLVDKE